jgi:D-galactarolactone cycloisomerase
VLAHRHYLLISSGSPDKFKVGGCTPEGRRGALPRRARGGAESSEAIRFARLVVDCDIAWFEEPCRWANDRHVMPDARYAADMRVCAGQSEYSAAGCRDLMAEGSIDICNLDASWSGGPTEERRAAAVALTYDVAMGHHEERQVVRNVLASIPHGSYVECFHPDCDPIWWNVVANRPPLSDGWLDLPGGPGLGRELDLDYVDRHRIST